MVLHQTFSISDIPKICVLIFLECILSADNALAMAAVIKPLTPSGRSKALFIGVFSAVLLRILAIFLISYYIHFFWVQLIGALYLLYLAVFYRIQSNKTQITTYKELRLWKIVLRLEMMDLLFALDSILAGVGVAGIPSKIWIVYLGGVLGLVFMRFATKLFAALMDRFSNLEKTSHYLIGWVGLKLCMHALYFYIPPSASFAFYAEVIFWIGIILLFIYGFLKKQRHSN